MVLLVPALPVRILSLYAPAQVFSCHSLYRTT